MTVSSVVRPPGSKTETRISALSGRLVSGRDGICPVMWARPLGIGVRGGELDRIQREFFVVEAEAVFGKRHEGRRIGDDLQLAFGM